VRTPVLDVFRPGVRGFCRLYFGLEGGREHTLEEIGSMLGVTRERVRQLRDRALKRLREGEVGRALGSFAAAGYVALGGLVLAAPESPAAIADG